MKLVADGTLATDWLAAGTLATNWLAGGTLATDWLAGGTLATHWLTKLQCSVDSCYRRDSLCFFVLRWVCSSESGICVTIDGCRRVKKLL